MPEKLKTNTRLGRSEGLRLSKDKFSFALANFGAKLFNDLPPTIKQCHDLKSFNLAIFLVINCSSILGYSSIFASFIYLQSSHFLVYKVFQLLS